MLFCKFDLELFRENGKTISIWQSIKVKVTLQTSTVLSAYHCQSDFVFAFLVKLIIKGSFALLTFTIPFCVKEMNREASVRSNLRLPDI